MNIFTAYIRNRRQQSKADVEYLERQLRETNAKLIDTQAKLAESKVKLNREAGNHALTILELDKMRGQWQKARDNNDPCIACGYTNKEIRQK